MTDNIDSVLNPPKDSVGVGNVDKMIALHELKLAKKISLELMRDCPEEIRSSLKEAFEEAISGLT